MAKASDLSNGRFIKYNGDLYVITELIHRTPGNLRAFYQAKMRNIKTGKLGENRFRPDEEVEIVRVEEKDLQYLYKDGSSIVVMDPHTFDQVYVDATLFGDSEKFLKEGLMVTVSFDDNDSAVYAKPPKSIEVEITYTEPGIKGDTATNSMKFATIETGAEIRVPLFINTGDKVKIQGETGEYMERVK